MKYISDLLLCVLVLLCSAFVQKAYAQATVSPETEECLGCHSEIHPGLVASWNNSRHSRVTPAEALKKEKLQRRISSENIAAELQHVVVGCYECHSLNTDKHQDSFEHNGYTINVVVSPNDCATCHSEEAEQYSKNMMSFAHTNLVDNSVYQELIKSVNSPIHFSKDKQLAFGKRDSLVDAESCLYCHGTKITVTGMETKETDFGDLVFPVLSGWPNQGVGRINPDGSRGACTSCHPRHDFSIETARKPYTCSECHKGPDVPAYKVYQVSKHGNIFSSKQNDFNFTNVPWVIGQDFTAPTCATCHAALLVSPDNTVVAERTHQFNDRLAWRIFGAPYAHPHPVAADLRGVINSQGLPLATELDGAPVAEFVISPEEQQQRDSRMQQICLSCHSSEWVAGHFKRLENSIRTTNAMTRSGTHIMSEIWRLGLADGLPQKANIFDEEIERTWTTLWLFHANSVRFSAAMAGGGDYSVFAGGRYQMTEKMFELQEWLKTHEQLHSLENAAPKK